VWKKRIGAKLNWRVEAIRSAHPALFERIDRTAHRRALESLGLDGPHAEMERIRAEEAILDRRRDAAQRAMIAAIRGVPTEEVTGTFPVRYGGGLSLPMEAATAIDRRQATHRDELLAEDPVGKQVADLEAEKERLLDVVWLACSPSQIRTLWSKVAELLGEEPTPLEREALAIAPPEGP
jgi:hypothetical protein